MLAPGPETNNKAGLSVRLELARMYVVLVNRSPGQDELRGTSWVTGWKVPLFQVGFHRYTLGVEVFFQVLNFPTIVETDDIVILDRFVD